MNTTIYIYVNKMIKRFINKPKKTSRYVTDTKMKTLSNYRLIISCRLCSVNNCIGLFFGKFRLYKRIILIKYEGIMKIQTVIKKQ